MEPPREPILPYQMPQGSELPDTGTLRVSGGCCGIRDPQGAMWEHIPGEADDCVCWSELSPGPCPHGSVWTRDFHSLGAGTESSPGAPLSTGHHLTPWPPRAEPPEAPATGSLEARLRSSTAGMRVSHEVHVSPGAALQHHHTQPLQRSPWASAFGC